MGAVLRWVFSTEVSLWVIALGIGCGLTMALAPTVRNVRLAHVFFLIATVWALGCTFNWLVSGDDIPVKYLLAFIIGGSIFTLAVVAFIWVESNHDEHLHAVKQPVPPKPTDITTKPSDSPLLESKPIKPHPLIKNPLEIVSFNSFSDLMIHNRSEHRIYIIDLQTATDFETNSTSIGVEIPPREVKSIPPKPGILSGHSLPLMAATFKEHVELVGKQYSGCVEFVYFSANDGGLSLIRDHYKKQSQELAADVARGVFHYRVDDGDTSYSQDVPLVVTTFVVTGKAGCEGK